MASARAARSAAASCAGCASPGCSTTAAAAAILSALITGPVNVSQAPCMPLYTDALLGDTLHLSVDEFGAYCLLLFATWRNNGQPLPDDDRKLARVCRVTDYRWKKLRPRLAPFFDISERKWRQKRLEREWKYVQKLAAVSRANGLKRRNSVVPSGNPAGNPEATQQVVPKPLSSNIYNKYNNNLS